MTRDGFNLASYVLSAGGRRPDHPALVIPGRLSLTHGALRHAVGRRAGGLAQLGLASGARVMLRLGNEPDFPITFLAACAVGLVPVPTFAQLTDEEVAKLADIVDPSLTVASPGLAVPKTCPVRAAGDLDADALPMDQWQRGSADRLGYIVFSSGSSGTPKAVAHAHRAIRARRAMHQGWYGLGPEDRVLHAGAFNWTYTLGTGLMDPWSVGATAIVPAAGTEAADLPALLAAEHATIFAAVPGVYRRLLRAPWPGAPALRHGLSAGERLPPGLREAWQKATGTDLHEALGMSECSTFISGAPARPAPPGTVGYVQDGRSVEVDGEALCIGLDEPGLMLGYWQKGRGPVMPEGPVFVTGDRVARAEDGAITHLGRSDDLLNPGGHRVSPQEVEAALADLPVRELAVGQVEVKPGVMVLAVYYAGDALDEQAAEALAQARLAPYKRPRLWLRRDALPRNANGKLIRRALG